MKVLLRGWLDKFPGLTTVVAPWKIESSLVAEVARLRPVRLGIEGRGDDRRRHLDLTRRLEAGHPAELFPMDGAVERLREVKDAWEVATLREAGQSSDVAGV